MAIEDCIYRSYNPKRKPSHPWPSWHNHTGSYPRFSYCPTPGLSIARYMEAFRQEPEAWECFAITDHAFSIAITEPGKSWPHNWYEDESILDEFRASGATQRRFAAYSEFCDLFRDGATFFTGMEIESSLSGRMAVTRDEMKGLDVVIGSIHHNPGDPEKWVERHFFQIGRVLALPCDIVGHPVRHLKAHSAPGSPLPQEIIDETLDMMKAAGVAVEINAHYPQIQDDVLMLQGAFERGMEVAFSMDLHYPEEFGNWRYFEDVVELSEIKYDELNLFRPRQCSVEGRSATV